ncbi:MAG TPA: DUF6174 domain-containing protein [Balneolaceae bacterium]
MSDHFKNLVFFCLLLFLSGCSLLGSEVNKQIQKLEENKKIWSQKSSVNYTYKLDKSCFCPSGLFPATIVVRADTIHAVMDPETNDTLRAEENNEPVLDLYPGLYKTIPELFGIIRNTLDDDFYKIDVKYNKTLGFPAYINIAPRDKRVADGGVLYEVNSLSLSN